MKVKLIKDYAEEKRGRIIEVTKNVAHGLIEQGIAKIVEVKSFVKKRRDKMMRRTNKKVKTK